MSSVFRLFLLLRQVREGYSLIRPVLIDRYKARAAFESVLDYLDTRHAAQLADGLTSSSDSKLGE